jgi:type IV pilus biogenesis protein CpaD/CtpE
MMKAILLIAACLALAGCASTDDPKPAGTMLDPVTHLEIIHVTVDAE